MASAPWLFLAASLVGASLTANAHLPIRGNRWLVLPSFLAGWLTAELVPHHLATQLLATAFFVSAGALEAWPGWLALGLTVLSWVGLVYLLVMALDTPRVMEQALLEGLGASYRAQLEASSGDRYLARPRHPWLTPFRRSDKRVRVHMNLRYAPGAGRRHLLDVYVPAAGAAGAPVLLQIHGGAWVTGHKRQQAVPMLLDLAARGWVCVSINYRLCPAATFPEPLVDCKLALAWIREHIAAYGGDPHDVTVTGGSAGGHLASLVALTANEPLYQPGFAHVDTRVRACVALYGVYDLTDRFTHQRHPGQRKLMEDWILKCKLDEAPDRFEQASPMSRVHAGAPPFFVIHGTHDCMASVEDARSFVTLLRQHVRGPVVYAELRGAHHAFEIFHSVRTSHTIHAIARFLGYVQATVEDDDVGYVQATTEDDDVVAGARGGAAVRARAIGGDIVQHERALDAMSSVATKEDASSNPPRGVQPPVRPPVNKQRR